MKTLKIALVTFSALMFLSVCAFAQEVVAPADSEDVNSFDAAITKSKEQERYRHQNRNKLGETKETKLQQGEKKETSETEGEVTEETKGNALKAKHKNAYKGDSTANKNKYSEKRSLGESKKVADPKGTAAQIANKEAEKIKNSGDQEQIRLRERTREELRTRDRSGTQTEPGTGSGQGPTDVIPDPNRGFSGSEDHGKPVDGQ